jgi:hypothetical protein
MEEPDKIENYVLPKVKEQIIISMEAVMKCITIFLSSEGELLLKRKVVHLRFSDMIFSLTLISTPS